MAQMYSGQRRNLREMQDAEEDVLQAIHNELKMIGQMLEAEIADYLDNHNINMDGELKQSISHEVQRSLAEIALEIGAGTHYAPYVHFGTDPHTPPIDPLKEYARKKLNLSGEEAKSAAYGIQTMISKFGTQAQPFIADVLEAHIDSMAKRISKAVMRGFG